MEFISYFRLLYIYSGLGRFVLIFVLIYYVICEIYGIFLVAKKHGYEKCKVSLYLVLFK